MLAAGAVEIESRELVRRLRAAGLRLNRTEKELALHAKALVFEHSDGARTLVTGSANQACFAAVMALVEPGYEVLLPSPWYFNHAMAVTSLGAVPVPVPMRMDEGYTPTVEEVARALTPRTKVLVLVNPNNPTGVRYPDSSIRDLADLAIQHDLWLLSDQTYQDLLFDAAPPLSPAAVDGAPDRAITVSSFSKSLGLAGWRLGFLAGHRSVVDEIVTTQERVTVTRNGRPVAVVLSTDDLEAIEETLAILSDPAAMREIKQGRAAIASGDVVTKDDIDALRTRFRSKTA